MRLFKTFGFKRAGGRSAYEAHVRDRSRVYLEELCDGNFVLVHIEPLRTLRFLGERERLFYPQARVDELQNRRSAQLSFYRSCAERTLDLFDNPYLEWMREHHPEGSWHGARSDKERMAICERHRDLFLDIESKGIRMPLRILQEKHFHLSDIKRAADGGNRLQIATVLDLPSVPNLIRSDLVVEAEAHGLL